MITAVENNCLAILLLGAALAFVSGCADRDTWEDADSVVFTHFGSGSFSLAEKPSAPVYNALGAVLRAQGKVGEAAQQFDRAKAMAAAG